MNNKPNYDRKSDSKIVKYFQIELYLNNFCLTRIIVFGFTLVGCLLNDIHLSKYPEI